MGLSRARGENGMYDWTDLYIAGLAGMVLMAALVSLAEGERPLAVIWGICSIGIAAAIFI